MHELSLAEEVLRIADESCREHGAKRIRAVHVCVGVLAGIEEDALRFAFEALIPETLADGASLQIESVPALGKCVACGADEPLFERFDPCPSCGGGPRHATGGTDFRVKNLDVE